MLFFNISRFFSTATSGEKSILYRNDMYLHKFFRITICILMTLSWYIVICCVLFHPYYQIKQDSLVRCDGHISMMDIYQWSATYLYIVSSMKDAGFPEQACSKYSPFVKQVSNWVCILQTTTIPWKQCYKHQWWVDTLAPTSLLVTPFSN